MWIFLFLVKEYERLNYKGIKDDEYKMLVKEKVDLLNGGDCFVWIFMELELELLMRNEICNNVFDIV